MKKRKSLPKLDIFNSLENVKMLSKISSFVTKLVSLNLLRFNFILPSCPRGFRVAGPGFLWSILFVSNTSWHWKEGLGFLWIPNSPRIRRKWHLALNSSQFLWNFTFQECCTRILGSQASRNLLVGFDKLGSSVWLPDSVQGQRERSAVELNQQFNISISAAFWRAQ